MKIEKEHINFKVQKIIVFFAFTLFVFKLVAWYLTNSVAIYSDALESIVNIIGSVLGLYSLYLTTIPKDENHPYGHGKIEFLSSGIEGVLICIAGIIIFIESIQNLFLNNPIHKIDVGIILVLSTAIFNFILGLFTLKEAKKNNSLVLESTGKHLLTDTISTVGIILGLLVIYFTNLFWLDATIGILLSLIIFITGYKIIRKSISGIMDEADEDLIQKICELLQKNRNEIWIDFHNLRVIKYGPRLHIDLHVTLPYFLNVSEAHDEIEKINDLINDYFGEKVELFIHPDPCMEFSCQICENKSCSFRKQEFVKSISWNAQNMVFNQKHQLNI